MVCKCVEHTDKRLIAANTCRIMRFSHFLKYNAVPEWNNHYMDYVELKNLIYTLQTDEIRYKRENGLLVEEDEDTTPPTRLQKLRDRWFQRKSGPGAASNAGVGSSAGVASEGASPGPETMQTGINDKKEEIVTEETFELQTMAAGRAASASTVGKNQGIPEQPCAKSKLQKVKEKFFESRRSSLSSDGKTVLGTYDSFVESLTVEKSKVDDFYKRMEAKFYEKYDTLLKDLEHEGVLSTSQLSRLDSVSEQASDDNPELETTRSSVVGRNTEDYDDDDDDDDDDDEFNADNTALLHYSQFNVKSQKKSILKQSIINLYIDLCQLKSFIELNKLGFSKITKKSDKVLHLHTREELIHSGEFFKDTYVFQNSTLSILSTRIAHLVEFYAIITGQPNDLGNAKEELKSSLHDHIVWERSNTWQDMLGLQSQSKNLTEELNGSNANDANIGLLQLEYYEWILPKPINLKFTKITKFMIPRLFFTWKALKIAIIFVFTTILLAVPTFHDEAQHRCMALVECVALLWATEAIPLHITAFLVPLLVVLFRVQKDSNGHVLKAVDASKTILATMWSSTIMILLAGFTLGEVLAKYNIARVVASWILAAAGVKPRNLLLVSMIVVFFMSMWISNVAAPVLTYSLLSPLLDPLEASNDFGKALVMGIALAANIGGLASPISSPQNVISMTYLKPYGVGWGQFFAVALPVGILAMLLLWVLMCVTFKINRTKLERFVPIRTNFTLKQYYIIFVSVGTILLWCVESKIEGAFGASGEIAILPIVLFFGTGLLETSDLKNFPWNIVILAMGGIALGSAVSSSGLLSTIARALQRRIENDGAFAILCIFGILMLVVGTFVSHTVAAIIVVPLVQEVGDKLDDPKAAPLLVFGCALLSSCGMALPSSGFPNVTAISMTDKNGDRYLSVKTFITRGLPASLLSFLCVITLGYGIMMSVLKGKTPDTH